MKNRCKFSNFAVLDVFHNQLPHFVDVIATDKPVAEA
jgi:hypothetical protein